MNKTLLISSLRTEDLVGQLLPLLDQMFGAVMDSTVLDPLLSKMDLVLDYMLKQADRLLGRPLTVDTLFATSPESARIFNLLDRVHTLVDVGLNSLLGQSPAMQALLIGDLATFCSSSLSAFTIKESQINYFNEARNVICSANYTTVERELSEFLDTAMLEKLVSLFLSII